MKYKALSHLTMIWFGFAIVMIKGFMATRHLYLIGPLMLVAVAVSAYFDFLSERE